MIATGTIQRTTATILLEFLSSRTHRRSKEGQIQVSVNTRGSKTSLKRHGFEPSRGHITVDEDGTIIDGHHRVGACKDLNIEIPETAIDVRSGLSWLEKRSLARRLNAETNGRPVTKQLKRDLIEQAITDYDEREIEVSNIEVASECGSSDKYGSEVRNRMAENDEIRGTSNLPISFSKRYSARFNNPETALTEGFQNHT
jgi:hypothetical protein